MVGCYEEMDGNGVRAAVVKMRVPEGGQVPSRRLGDFQVQASKLLQPSALAQSLCFGSCLSQSFQTFKKPTWLKYQLTAQSLHPSTPEGTIESPVSQQLLYTRDVTSPNPEKFSTRMDNRIRERKHS
ncbi:hypothetical protein ATANTOWER_000434 [Ataeniobius toweri]|uniref:Uncharacterized protein n=1 Tax=Ataeniobius toweri TaxID=208326 RepID=A0ABU7ALW1_9TELE|nr:hypothetical protein [Ataeniobius toweri]